MFFSARGRGSRTSRKTADSGSTLLKRVCVCVWGGGGRANEGRTGGKHSSQEFTNTLVLWHRENLTTPWPTNLFRIRTRSVGYACLRMQIWLLTSLCWWNMVYSTNQPTGLITILQKYNKIYAHSKPAIMGNSLFHKRRCRSLLPFQPQSQYSLMNFLQNVSHAFF